MFVNKIIIIVNSIKIKKNVLGGYAIKQFKLV